MVEREYRDFIIDMIEAADMVASFIQGMNKEQFLADKKTQFAVVRALEIIGEAAVISIHSEDHSGRYFWSRQMLCA